MKNLRIISTILILALLTTSLSTSYGALTKFEYRESNFSDEHNVIDSPKLNINLNIHETSTVLKNQEVVVLLHKKPTKTYGLTLLESINFSNVKADGTASIILLQSNTNQIMISRLSSPRKELDNSLDILSYTGISDLWYSDPPIHVFDGILALPVAYADQYLPDQFILPIIPSIEFLDLQNNNNLNNIGKTLSNVIGTAQQPSELLLFVFVFSTFIIVRSENSELRINNYRKILSYSFIVLLSSSAVISPISISYSYYAYAENVNSTLTIDTNSTLIADQIPEPIASIDSDVLSDQTSYVGEVYLNQTELVMNGGYVKLDGDTTNSNSNFTISTWIKPDYQTAQPTYTIASKQNSFKLALNNIVEPKNKILFSIFDGSKWYPVRSTVKITENWSHVAATSDVQIILKYRPVTNEIITAK